MITPARRIAAVLGFAILTATTLAAPHAAQPAYLAPDNFDFKSLLGDPPAEGSAQQKQEIDALLDLQAHRDDTDAARCKSEETVTVFTFSSVLGEKFNKDQLPLTAEFMAEVVAQAKPVYNGAKALWNRPRPPLADKRIQPCVAMEASASYPSGHATRGMLWGKLLAEIFPAHRDALLALGRQIGDDRALAGMHYPSDVAAGQKLGAEIAKRMLADADFQAKLEKVKAECDAMRLKVKSR